MKGKLCSENECAREGFFGKKVAKKGDITGLQGPLGVDPLSPPGVRAPLKGEIGPGEAFFGPCWGLPGVSRGADWGVHAEPDDRTAPHPAGPRHRQNRGRDAAKGGPE